MLDVFAQMTPEWFKRATFYTGSVGPFLHDFRFRWAQDCSDPEHPKLCAAVYSGSCYEKATDVEQEMFPWDADGVEALKVWFQEHYDAYAAKQSAS